MIHTNYSTIDESFKQRYEAGQQLVKLYQERMDLDRWVQETCSNAKCSE